MDKPKTDKTKMDDTVTKQQGNKADVLSHQQIIVEVDRVKNNPKAPVWLQEGLETYKDSLKKQRPN